MNASKKLKQANHRASKNRKIPQEKAPAPKVVAADDGAIPNFDPAVVGADIKAKLAEADKFEAERKETVDAAKAVYDAERIRTSDEMAAAKLVCNTATTAATKKYGALIKEAHKAAGTIIVAALKSHPEQAEKIRKASGLEKGRWSELFRIAGGKLTAEENKANSAARQQDKRSKDRAAAGKQPTKHDIERAATKAVRDRSDEGVSRTTQATQTTESAETATTNGADHEESATTATETNGTNAGTAEATALDLARAAYFELMPSDYEGRKLELVDGETSKMPSMRSSRVTN